MSSIFARVKAARAATSAFYAANPRTASACTGGLTFSLGDALAQRLERQRDGPSAKPFNAVRSAQLGAFGMVMNGAFLYQWYSHLDKVFGSSQKSVAGVLAKMAAEQLIYAPFSITMFFYFSAARKSSSVAEANATFRTKFHESFFTTFCADCMLWPCSNAINFRFVPLVFRPTWTACTQFVWQTYLSLTSNAPAPALELVPASSTAAPAVVMTPSAH